MDCLQEWAPAKAVTKLFSFFKGPSKAAEAFGLAPNRYSARLHDFLENALGEGKKEQEAEQKWSDAVRTAGAKQRQELSPHGLPTDARNAELEETTEMYGSIRPLSQALTSKEIELQRQRLVGKFAFLICSYSSCFLRSCSCTEHSTIFIELTIDIHLYMRTCARQAVTSAKGKITDFPDVTRRLVARTRFPNHFRYSSRC